uniref:Uncharacterized protein n=1 Tax=Neolamprologus brichardi TaxID=32507 RepID=A0A3Q4H2G2_NEOBR
MYKCCRRPLAPNQPLLSNSQQAENCTATVAITGNCACVCVCVWSETSVLLGADSSGSKKRRAGMYVGNHSNSEVQFVFK